jgi:hypothetical protein
VFLAVTASDSPRAANLLLCAVCLLKGKVVTGVIGIVISVVALVGAIRLAKPGSW